MSVCLLAEGDLIEARTDAELEEVRRLFRAYARWLEVDLCFQGFEEELSELPGRYAPPAGRLLLARVAGEAVGAVGLRPLEPGICEMKRLWVEPGFGGRGIGRALAEAAVAAARTIGYERMRLDTIPARMPAAQHLYRSLGFAPIPPYYHNPLDGVVMLELRLPAAAD
ncbi:MAG TPA: GNAT family N-acetyltransferase [Geminicoccaceae bacterium]|nr:GNAT family N-acetyltransferase [Geminicoccaceae bacterium]